MDTIIFGKNGFVGHGFDIKNSICPKKNECDLLSYNSVLNYFKKYQNNEIKIINLSAKVAGFIYNKDHNVEMLYENTIMSLNLIKVLKELNIKTYLIYISSVCCYEKSFKEIEVLNGRPHKSNYGYGIGKRNGIFALESLKIDKPDLIDYCILIPTNMYGEYDNFQEPTSHVIPNIIRKMHEEKEIKILGNCLNKRDFLYVKDLGNIIKICLETRTTGIYNVSSNKSISIKKLVLLLKKLINYKGKIIFSENDEPNNRNISNKELLKKIKYKFTPIEEGLNNTILFYNSK